MYTIDKGCTQIPAQALAAEQTLALGKQVRVEVLASASTGSALRLEWQNFLALIPAGTPLERFATSDFTELSLLILDSRDLEKTTPEQWLAFSPQAVIATPEDPFTSLAGNNWFNTQAQGWYQVITDGKRLWVEKGR